MQIGEVARATGVSVRTLHHWEAVGLVAPGRSNGYRAYDDSDVATVRSVLAWRTLGLSLDDIRNGLTTARLEQQHALLLAEGERIAAMTGAVRRALEARSMGIELDPSEVTEVFGADDPSRHATEVRERWGDTDSYAESRRRTSSYAKDDWLRMRAEQEALEQRMAAAMQAGENGVALAREHQDLIRRWFYECTPEVHLALAETYVADERFRHHYERRAGGLAAWLRNAIVASHT